MVQSEEVLRRARVPTLLIGPHSRGFVDAQSGKIRLRRILLPVAPEPEPSPAWTLNMLSSLLSPLGVSGDSFELIHVAGEMPDIMDEAGKTWKVEHLKGPIVETIVRVAKERAFDLIAMATAGNHGFLDGLRGSTTSQVVADAPCPVLALPAIALRGTKPKSSLEAGEAQQS